MLQNRVLRTSSRFPVRSEQLRTAHALSAHEAINFFPGCADKQSVTTSAAALAKEQLHPAGSRFIARQPILTREEQIFGYELLFRDGIENYFRAIDPDEASRSTLVIPTR